MIMSSGDRRGRTEGNGDTPQEGETGIFRLKGGQSDGETSPVDYEYLAADLHAANRRRTELFRHAVMADKVMDIMLTALIAHEQGTALSRKAVAMANRLPVEEADGLIAALAGARLLETGTMSDRIGLTAAGVERMREYLRQVRRVPMGARAGSEG